MNINEDIYNELNSKLYNQDNNGVWINPVMQKTTGKLYLLFIYLFVAIFLLKDFNMNHITVKQIVFYLAHLIIFLLALIFFIRNKIKAKMFIKKQEEKNKEQIEINLEYYREILEEFSPGVLAFCYNKNLKYEDVIISTLLAFKDKYIKLDIFNKNIHILPEKNYENLKEHEKYFLREMKEFSNDIKFEELKKIITNTYFKSNFLNFIKQDCKNSNYFKTNYHGNNGISYIFIFYIFIFTISCISMLVTLYKDIIFVGITNMCLLLWLMYLDRKNSYIKTSKGYELNIKLNGLKKYLLDYSTIKDKKINDITIWEYYIIYAIILDLKGNLDKEVSSLYKDIS